MMTEINLLPWREERRHTRQREFIAMLVGAAIIGAAIWWLWSQSITSAIETQTARNQFIEQNIAQLDQQIKEIADLEKQRAELVARMKVIQDLQGNRPSVVHVFDQLVRTLPDGVYYTSVERKGTNFAISGVAENNNQISSLMRNLAGSPWFSTPVLQTVAAKGENTNTFSLTVKQGAPAPEADDKGGVK